MFSKKTIATFTTFVSLSAFANYEDASSKYGTGNVSLVGYREMIIDLSKDGYYYSLIPWVKDHLAKYTKRHDAKLTLAIDEVMSNVGVKTFESLPEEILTRVNSLNVNYILAKRELNSGNIKKARRYFDNIDPTHQIYPFMAHLQGVIYAQQNRFKDSTDIFNECVKSSERRASSMKDSIQKDQLLQNRDYCLAGIARSYYGMKDYKKAELSYIDIDKSSFIWPNLLVEEAWNSYKLKNYNRTLGKLVTYKAPVLDFVFNPEVEVLKALSYLKMCLYEDARNTADDFYSEHSKNASELRNFILRNRKNYKFYYDLMANFESGKNTLNPHVNKSLRSIEKDGAYQEIKASLSSAVREYRKIQKLPMSSLRSQLLRNMKVVLEEYKLVLGSYVRSSMVSKYAEIYRAFEDMSYIKLEVLAQRKERIYKDQKTNGKRGDVKYIDRNDKQYFWNFNGEFWADELGDYVFALRSEC